jgi:hypothetical protein
MNNIITYTPVDGGHDCSKCHPYALCSTCPFYAEELLKDCPSDCTACSIHDIDDIPCPNEGCPAHSNYKEEDL